MERLEPMSIDELILEQPNRDARLQLLAAIGEMTDARNPYLSILTYAQWSAFIDVYAVGHLPMPKLLPPASTGVEEVPPRDLFSICQGTEYFTILAGNSYCRLAMGDRRHECPFLGTTKDHNGIYPCYYEPKHMKGGCDSEAA